MKGVSLFCHLSKYNFLSLSYYIHSWISHRSARKYPLTHLHNKRTPSYHTKYTIIWYKQLTLMQKRVSFDKKALWLRRMSAS